MISLRSKAFDVNGLSVCLGKNSVRVDVGTSNPDHYMIFGKEHKTTLGSVLAKMYPAVVDALNCRAGKYNFLYTVTQKNDESRLSIYSSASATIDASGAVIVRFEFILRGYGEKYDVHTSETVILIAGEFSEFRSVLQAGYKNL